MNDRAAFLAGSIADMQATIRAVDVKVAAILVGLLTPLQNLHRVFGHIKHFCDVSPRWPAICVSILFLTAWVLGFIALVRAISAVGNPAAHIINRNHLKGSFFLGGLYPFKFLDAFLDRPIIMAGQDPATIQANLPQTSADVEAELVFEQMKLAYIRDIKINRLYWGLILSLFWLFLGVAIFISSKFVI
jgi:hypothetical protein